MPWYNHRELHKSLLLLNRNKEGVTMPGPSGIRKENPKPKK